MSGFAVAVARDGHPDLQQLRAMAGAARYRASAGLREASLDGAAAIYLDGAEEPGVGRSSPLFSPDGSLLIVADARLDNRHDIASALGSADLAAGRDDGRLVLQAYQRWGERFADRLSGDFAVVVWDSAARRLVAARDAMAMRPLVYLIESERILIASEVKQILAAAAVPPRLCEQHVAAVLAGIPGFPDQTFYENVRRLPPGHTLVVDASGARLRQHSSVAMGHLRPVARAEEHAERLRGSLTDAVLARLEVARSPALLLSGGLDSMAIAGVAGALSREANGGRSLQTYSFAYEDLPGCDERTVSGVVTAHYGMPNLEIPTAGAWPLGDYPDHGPDIDGPDRLRSHLIFSRVLDAAHQDGVGVLMSGYRGDSVIGDIVGYLGRLREAGPRALWRDLTEHAHRSRQPRGRLLYRHVVQRIPGAVWPSGALAAARRHLRKVLRPASLPPWLTNRAIERFNLRDLAAEMSAAASPGGPALSGGEATRRRHQLIFDAQHGRNAEALERLFARSGLRHVDPWTDHRLVALALHTPQHVITPAGESKRLLRDAMRDVLPEVARAAAAKRSPQMFYERGLLDRSRDVVWSLIERSQAAARGYVDERALRTAYSDFLERPGRVGEREWRVFWRFLDVEDWLRRFHS